MSAGVPRWLLVAVLLLTGLALRVPGLWDRPASMAEMEVVGSAAAYLGSHDVRVAPLNESPPLAHLLASGPDIALDTPSVEWDPEGPDCQIGFRVLRDSTARGTDRPVPVSATTAIARAPAVLLALLAIYVLYLLGERLYGRWCGFFAGFLFAVHTPLLTELMTPDRVAAAACVLLLAFAVEFWDAACDTSPRGLRRRRIGTLAFGVTLGMSLLSSVVGPTLVAAVLVWALSRPNSARRLGATIAPGFGLRFGAAVVIALAIAWGAYAFEAGGGVPAPRYVESLRRAWSLDAAGAGPVRSWAVTAPSTALVVLVGLLAYWDVREHRNDVPTLLHLTLLAPLIALWFAEPPSHAACLAVALPPGALLFAAGLARWRQRRVVAFVAGLVALLGVVALPAPESPQIFRVTQRRLVGSGSERARHEDWMLRTWIEIERPDAVLDLRPLPSTELEEHRLVIRGTGRVERHAPSAALLDEWLAAGDERPVLVWQSVAPDDRVRYLFGVQEFDLERLPGSEWNEWFEALEPVDQFDRLQIYR